MVLNLVLQNDSSSVGGLRSPGQFFHSNCVNLSEEKATMHNPYAFILDNLSVCLATLRPVSSLVTLYSGSASKQFKALLQAEAAYC